MSHRTFIALDVDDTVRRRLTAMRDAMKLAVEQERPPGRGDKIHWVSPENFHVTLKFLGDVADAQLADVGRTVQAVAAQTQPFDFTVGGLRIIPPTGRELRMFWADVAEPDGRIAGLFTSLEQALEPLGFARENCPFAQHITLARVKYARNAEVLRAATTLMAAENAGLVRAEYVTVYTSRLSPGRPIYTPAVKAWLGHLAQEPHNTSDFTK